MTLREVWNTMLALVGVGPEPFHPTTINGVPNLTLVAPRLWRMGQPANPAAWEFLQRVLGDGIVVVKLNEDGEGVDTPPAGWTLIKAGIPPYDDRPWTVLEKPDPVKVQGIVNTIADAYFAGKTVVWHCTAGRERTGLVSALVQIRLFDLPREAAWKDMLAHGFRWGAVDLDEYWLSDAR